MLCLPPARVRDSPGSRVTGMALVRIAFGVRDIGLGPAPRLFWRPRAIPPVEWLRSFSPLGHVPSIRSFHAVCRAPVRTSSVAVGEADVGHAHSSPSACDRKENVGHFRDESLLLFQRELDVSVALPCEASVAKILPPTRKSGEPMWELSSAPSKLRAMRRKSLAVHR